MDTNGREFEEDPFVSNSRSFVVPTQSGPVGITANGH